MLSVRSQSAHQHGLVVDGFAHAHLVSPSSLSRMPASSSIPSGSTSVFNVLATYADRSKEKREQPSASSSSRPRSSSSIAKATASAPAISSSSLSPAQAASAPAEAQEDDSLWQTVQVTRRKTVKEKEKENAEPRRGGGSNSRDWRERPNQSATKEKAEDIVAQRRTGSLKQQQPSSSATASKKATGVLAAGSSTSASPSPSTAQVKPQHTSASVGAGSGTKLAWGYVPSPSASGTQTPALATGPSHGGQASQKASESAPSAQAATPTSPSLNGTTLTATASVADSIDADSTDTAVTSTVMKTAEDEDPLLRGRVKELDDGVKEVPQASHDERGARPDASASRPAAVNAWVQQSSAVDSVPLPKAEAPVQAQPSTSVWGTDARLRFGTLTPEDGTKPLPVDPDLTQAVQLGKKKKRPTGNASGAPQIGATLNDSSAWPDVATAAEVIKQKEEQKSQTKVKKEDEPALPQASGSKGKKKWTAIPAAELLAAVDEVAESNRRQARVDQQAKKKRRGSSVASSPARPGRAGAVTEPRKGRAGVPVNPEIRLPPQPHGSRRSSIAFVPTFGTVRPGSDGVSEIHESSSVADGGPSAPLSRQTSRQSRKSEPRKASTQLSSPVIAQLQLEASMQQGSALPYNGRQQSNTAPLPQQPFPGGNHMPKVPRNRDGRQSFSGSGKGRSAAGGYRGGPPRGGQMMHGWMGPQDAYYANGFPAVGMYGGPGYTGMIPLQAGYAYDGGLAGPSFMNMGVAARGGMPPPPMPTTVVPNLEPLRFYLLGQVEFYFSMQNLAMDFFLRQQMDAEGWIDISMISSFNRVKSFTPDISVVREVMLLSSLLEVREDKVRLAGSEAKRWVLPHAKPSPFASEGDDSEGTEDGPIGDGLGSSGDSHNMPGTIGLEGLGAGPASLRGFELGGMGNHLDEMEYLIQTYRSFGVEDVTQTTAMPRPRFDARGVESALMKGGARGLSSADMGHTEELGAVGLGGGLSSSGMPRQRVASNGAASELSGLGIDSGAETTEGSTGRGGEGDSSMDKTDTPATSTNGDADDKAVPAETETGKPVAASA